MKRTEKIAIITEQVTNNLLAPGEAIRKLEKLNIHGAYNGKEIIAFDYTNKQMINIKFN